MCSCVYRHVYACVCMFPSKSRNSATLVQENSDLRPPWISSDRSPHSNVSEWRVISLDSSCLLQQMWFFLGAVICNVPPKQRDHHKLFFVAWFTYRQMQYSSLLCELMALKLLWNTCWGRASYCPDAHWEPLLWILLVIITTENGYHFVFYNSRQRLLATRFFPKN